jgi:hypothetical protein
VGTVALLPDIQGGLREFLKSKKKMVPQHVNRISAMDDDCLRRLYYRRHDWDKATENEDGLQGVLETGHILEPVIERIVSEVGLICTPRFRIVGSQTTTNDRLLKEYQISGSIDGFLQIDDGENWETAGVVDIKTMSPNVYPRINGYEDLVKYSWTRRYRGQLMLYALAHNLEKCYLLLVNKTNLFDMTLIEFDVDMEYCDRLLENARKVNEAIEYEIAPEGINDPDECPRCQFFSFCCPNLSTGGNLKIIDNGELEAILDRMDELSLAADEYKELEKARDAILQKGQDIFCGSWLVTWKKIEKNMSAQPAKEATIRTEWRKTITRGQGCQPISA